MDTDSNFYVDTVTDTDPDPYLSVMDTDTDLTDFLYIFNAKRLLLDSLKCEFSIWDFFHKRDKKR